MSTTKILFCVFGAIGVLFLVAMIIIMVWFCRRTAYERKLQKRLRKEFEKPDVPFEEWQQRIQLKLKEEEEKNGTSNT